MTSAYRIEPLVFSISFGMVSILINIMVPTMNKKELLRHEFLKDAMLQMLSGYKPGDKFLSVREMMERFSVSQATVDRTLSFFYENRMLEKLPGKGIFVSRSIRRRSPEHKAVGLELPDWPSESYHMMLCALRDAAISRDFEIIPVYHQADNYNFDLPDNIDAMLWYSVDAFLDPASRRRLEGLSVPLVLACTPEYGISVDYVGDDEVFGGALLARHLIDLGHKSLAIIGSEPVDKVCLRIKGFRQQCQLSGVACKLLDCHTRSGESSAKNAFDMIKSEFHGGDVGYSGIFVVSSHSAIGALSALSACGLSVPGDISVVAYDAIPSAAFFHPPLTTIDTRIDLQAPLCLDALRKRMNGPSGPPWVNVQVEPELIVRASSDVRKMPS